MNGHTSVSSLLVQSLVNAGENQSYETFSEEPARQRNKDDSPTMLDSDEEDGGSTRSKPKKTKPHVKRSPVVSLFVYIMKQSYVLSLIAMMVGLCLIINEW